MGSRFDRNVGRRVSSLENGGQRRHRPDYWLPLICSFLLVIGLVVIYAISPGLAIQKGVSENYYVNKQFIAIALGIISFVALSRIPLGFWRKTEKPLLIASVVASIAVRLFGDQVNGAYRWIQVGGMSFQAAELIKFTLLLWLAGFLVDRYRQGVLGDTNKTLKPLLIALAVIGFVVGIVQSDFGSTAVMVAMITAMSFIIGLPMKKIMLIGGVVAIGLVLLVSSTPYRRARLQTFLQPERDCQNAGYQVCQALIAVGSGGVFGLGVGNSVQAFGYLPEAQNDSIFAILAEKFGFLGVSVLIGLFAAFFSRLFKIAEHAPDEYSQLIVVGVLAWLSTQTIINVGAMVGLLPLKGITLPFISSGGTSLLFVTGALGIVFNISRYTTFGFVNHNRQELRYESASYRRGNGGSYNTPVSRRPQA